ncbi:hypothetical protein AB1Y20_021435 [Prymnesium parvum]|uniref:RGS domain-containing protein n=1 Tax=Prymnesium parvum TaxID=97485 RepID=A0AB34JM30_PRYPA
MGCAGSKDNVRESQSDTVLLRRRFLNTCAPSVRLTERVLLDFHLVMADPDGVQAMLEFTASEMSDENMLFWKAVQEFKLLGGPPEQPSPRKSLLPVLDSINVDKAKLQEEADKIINTFLTPDAETPVNISSAHAKMFKKKPAPGVYEYSLNMFDPVEIAVYKDLKNDTFRRFRLSDMAEALVRSKPLLACNDPSEAFSNSKVQEELQKLMRAASKIGNCDRMTAYMVQKTEMFSVCSTNLGNGVLRMPLGKGLAGTCARRGVDVIVNDVDDCAEFDKSVDKETGYTTKSIMCVVIKRNNSVQAVIQLLNKLGNDGSEFTQEEADLIRDKVGPPLLNLFEDVALQNVE